MQKYRALPLQTRFAQPRRADARRSWLCVRLRIANHVFRSERTSCNQERLA
jgi:hypothetical protein